MSGEHHSNWEMQTKAIVAAVVLGVLAGEVVTFFGGLANTTGWDIVKLPCECAWAVLALPLGWLGLIVGGFVNTRRLLAYPYVFLWTGVTMNACLWGWVTYRCIKAMRGQATYRGFDASAISSHIAEMRHNHVLSAHSRWKPLHNRKGLIGAARQAISRCAYFLRTEPERRQSAEADNSEM